MSDGRRYLAACKRLGIDPWRPGMFAPAFGRIVQVDSEGLWYVRGYKVWCLAPAQIPEAVPDFIEASTRCILVSVVQQAWGGWPGWGTGRPERWLTMERNGEWRWWRGGGVTTGTDALLSALEACEVRT